MERSSVPAGENSHRSTYLTVPGQFTTSETTRWTTANEQLLAGEITQRTTVSFC